MTSRELEFAAITEASPGRLWQARWHRSWPAYEAWFLARGGDNGPSRDECQAALANYMPELVPVHAALLSLAGGSDRAARFLSTWCPPRYLGGCSIAALAKNDRIHLVRNYDLAPDLNEGLLLRSEWTGTPVMGMVEFLWGLSDGINDHGLAMALAYGGRPDTSIGFGVTTIMRYALELCSTVEEAIAVFERVPSHMAYNITLADKHGASATIELEPGGGVRRRALPIATNHQTDSPAPPRAGFTQTFERSSHLAQLLAENTAPEELGDHFLEAPLFQNNYDNGFGTLFTADYEPINGTVKLLWPGTSWQQSLTDFEPGTRRIGFVKRSECDVTAVWPHYGDMLSVMRPYLHYRQALAFDRWRATTLDGEPDWAAFANVFRTPQAHTVSLCR